MCSPRWFSRRGNHTLIWTSIVANSVSSKRDNVLRSWGFERVRLRKGHSKCYWNHAIFLRRTFTLIVIRCPFDTSDIDIYIYIYLQNQNVRWSSQSFLVCWSCHGSALLLFGHAESLFNSKRDKTAGFLFFLGKRNCIWKDHYF